MLTLYDYLPSQNGYKVRLLLSHLDLPYESVNVSIFEGEGQRPEYLAINPTGAVPAIRLDDGRVLAESNAILAYLAEGTRYLPGERFARAKVLQWLSFEADYVQVTIGSLRYWTLTGKLPARAPSLVEGKRLASLKALRAMDRTLAKTPFITGDDYTIADMSLFAYSHLAGDAGIDTVQFPHFEAWTGRVRMQSGFLATVYPYSIDPASSHELP
jgi:glutathione S-transferase